MSNSKKTKKQYEPPIVKEIGGIFEQAMGVSQCTTGSRFSGAGCNGGGIPAGDCPGGPSNFSCQTGSSDTGSCSRGPGAVGGCSSGPRA